MFDSAQGGSVAQGILTSHEKRLQTLLEKHAKPYAWMNELSTEKFHHSVGWRIHNDYNIGDGFDDMDFLTLHFAPKETFTFLKNFNKLKKQFSSYEIGRFLTVLNDKYSQMWSDWLTESGRRKEYKYSQLSMFGQWLTQTQGSRPKVFQSLLAFTMKHPNTPVEFLSELI